MIGVGWRLTRFGRRLGTLVSTLQPHRVAVGQVAGHSIEGAPVHPAPESQAGEQLDAVASIS